MKVQPLHLPCFCILHASGVVDKQKDEWFLWILLLLTLDDLLKKSPPLPIDSVMIPGRFLKEASHAAQVTVRLRLTSHCCDGLSSIAKDDTVHDG